MATFFLPLTLALYFIGTVLFLVYLVRRSEPLAKTALGITGIGFLTHTCGLTLQMFMTGDFPIVSFHKALSFFSWSLVLVFLVVALRNGLHVLGAFILPLSFLSLGFVEALTLMASVYGGVYIRFSGELSEASKLFPLFSVAMIFALVTIVAMTIMGLYERYLREGKWGMLLRIIGGLFLSFLAMSII